MLNVHVAQKVVLRLCELGVRQFIFCAGARNSPLFVALNSIKDIQITNFYDERSAGFFALGLSTQLKQPVAVITTSGTAVAELLPAVIESHYQQKPLIVISADRPKSYRGTGAPQAIEQKNIFGCYIQHHLDLQAESLPFFEWDQKGPMHWNLCFDEPLIDASLEVVENPFSQTFTNKSAQNPLSDLIEQAVLVVGPLDDSQMPLIEKQLIHMKAPIYCEVLSGLRGKFRSEISERAFEWALKNGKAKTVVRIGSVPTLRAWRDLEKKWSHVRVVNFSDHPWTGLSRPCEHLKLAQLGRCANPWTEEIVEHSQSLQKKLQELLKEFPKSEPALIAQLQAHIQERDLYLGNSLPIREFDLVAWRLPVSRVYGNRGANGIDGQLSTFFGWMNPTKKSCAVIGDLTALYDLNALGISVDHRNASVVVINNSGGMIFRKLFKSKEFTNEHNLAFKDWAKMFGWGYEKWEQIPAAVDSVDHKVIEIVPDQKQSDAFWSAWEST
jgi:2-succinyl-5-enolpyruvyl-6-hydroxy-3-cyclohexene-1-carboxylate synthase